MSQFFTFNSTQTQRSDTVETYETRDVFPMSAINELETKLLHNLAEY